MRDWPKEWKAQPGKAVVWGRRRDVYALWEQCGKDESRWKELGYADMTLSGLEKVAKYKTREVKTRAKRKTPDS